MHGNRAYLAPIDVEDGSTPAEVGHGKYTLTASHTYVYLNPTRDTPFASMHLTGYDAALIITSATIQDCNHAGRTKQEDVTSGDVSDVSTTVGEWMNMRPPNGYVEADGTGWSVGTGATADVVAAAGSGAGGTVGGAMWHIAETGSARMRLIVVVGATGGIVRVSGAGK